MLLGFERVWFGKVLKFRRFLLALIFLLILPCHQAHAIPLIPDDIYVDLSATLPDSNISFDDKNLNTILPVIESLSVPETPEDPHHHHKYCQTCAHGVLKRGMYSWDVKGGSGAAFTEEPRKFELIVRDDLPFEAYGSLPVKGRTKIPVKELQATLRLDRSGTMLVHYADYPIAAVRFVSVKDGKLKFQVALLETITRIVFDKNERPADPKNFPFRYISVPSATIKLIPNSAITEGSSIFGIKDGEIKIGAFTLDEKLDLTGEISGQINLDNRSLIRFGHNQLSVDSLHLVPLLEFTFSNSKFKLTAIQRDLSSRTHFNATGVSLSMPDAGLTLSTPSWISTADKVDVCTSNEAGYPQLSASLINNLSQITCNFQSSGGSANFSVNPISNLGLTVGDDSLASSARIGLVVPDKIVTGPISISVGSQSINLQSAELDNIVATISDFFNLSAKSWRCTPASWSDPSFSLTLQRPVLESTSELTFDAPIDFHKWNANVACKFSSDSMSLQSGPTTCVATRVGQKVGPISIVGTLGGVFAKSCVLNN